ncbi:hypothetical protein KKB83_01560 [Patescibacteria group bacterium]|nr:hypothetical protein [Patescibacteria group bacterium]
MPKCIGYDGLKDLKVGDDVEYEGGRGDYYVKAMATVSRPPGSTGCFVRITKIVRQGSKSTRFVGEEVVAGAQELYKESKPWWQFWR